MTGARGRGDDDSVRHYLREAGAHPLLTGAEEVELAKAMAAGRAAGERLRSGRVDDVERARLLWLVDEGDLARDRFIAANLRLVVSIAKRYRTAGLPLADLIQEGNIGLMRAVEKFDHSKGFKFSTYATWWVRQAVSRSIAEKGRAIRVPAHVADTSAALDRAAAAFTVDRGRPPTLAELSGATGIPAERIEAVRRASHEVVSLHAPVGDDAELADLLPADEAGGPEDALARRDEQDAISLALARLTEREQEVLHLRFGLDGGQPKTLEDVGREFALTRERIRQIEAKALTKLRHPTTPAALRQLVG